MGLNVIEDPLTCATEWMINRKVVESDEREERGRDGGEREREGRRDHSANLQHTRALLQPSQRTY